MRLLFYFGKLIYISSQEKLFGEIQNSFLILAETVYICSFNHKLKKRSYT